MTPFLLTLALLAADEPTATGEGSAALKPPAPPSAADTVVAAAFKEHIGTASETVKSQPVDALPLTSLAVAGLGLMLVVARRRQVTRTSNITIVETAALGPKRSLVIADVLGERIVLGLTEAGLTVLSSRPAPAPEPEPFVIPPAEVPLAMPTAPKMGFFDRLRGRVAASPQAPAFDQALRESLEDEELRAKLQAGYRGVVP
jgi:flagellar biogenesis protein FliO